MKAIKTFFATDSKSWALLLVRLALGVVILPHGMQKALGLFGGYGLEGTLGFFSSMGMPVVLGVFGSALALLLGGGGKWSIDSFVSKKLK